MNIDRSNSLSHSSEEQIQWETDINDNAGYYIYKLMYIF